MAVAKLGRTLADYQWGGPGAISRLFGWGEHSEPEAEWWLGVHPLRPSTLAVDGTPLAAWLQRHGGGGELPYLFKVLAPAMPLSLQVHPSTAQAAEGFEREVRSRMDLDDPLRLFKDPFAKPELVVALDGGFSALAGVRPVEEAIQTLKELDPDDQSGPLQGFRERLASQGVAETVRWVMSAGDEVTPLVTALLESAAGNDTLRRLTEHFPTDPGVAVGLLLHRVDLAPGEALFVDAGVPHAYLEGYAVELMAPSDNVLRGGLTAKHVDVEAFLDVADFTPGPIPWLSPERKGDVDHYEPAGHGFGLSRVTGDDIHATATLTGPSIFLCTDGSFQLRGSRGSRTAQRGEAWVASHSESPITLEGSGELWWAGPR